ncbi:MAG: hypothetical protein V4649_03850 [Bacteroidota bacterium]
MPSSILQGDRVIVMSDRSIVYTVTAVYAEGRHAICKYLDNNNQQYRLLSIPVVALKRYRAAAPVKAIGPFFPGGKVIAA